MTKFSLSKEAVNRLKAYHDWVLAGKAAGPGHEKSDYWIKESRLAQIQFGPDWVGISGSSGFYVPPDAHDFMARIKARLQDNWKRAVVAVDRRLRLSFPHSLNTCVTPGMAYDQVARGDPGIDFDPNPHRLDHRTLKFPFATSQALRSEWFLHGRYFADGHVITTAYFHTLFTHWLPPEARLYLEIGAGNGNLASFIRHYRSLKTVIVDLPETILYSYAYLTSIFPDSRASLPNEVEGPVTEAKLLAADFIFLLPNQVSLLPADTFDLAVNVHSMQEMTGQQIAEYIQTVQRVLKRGGLWCNANRVEKVPDTRAPATRAFAYPYVPDNEVLVNEVDRYMRLIQLDGIAVRIERKR